MILRKYRVTYCSIILLQKYIKSAYSLKMYLFFLLCAYFYRLNIVVFIEYSTLIIKTTLIIITDSKLLLPFNFKMKSKNVFPYQPNKPQKQLTLASQIYP